MNGNGSQSRSHHGFTLLELIVVIGIIIILISILIPALSNSRIQAQIADTKSQLAGLSSACEQYNQIFQAYPGPLTEQQVNANSGVVSGNQNLLIGLGRKHAGASGKAGSVSDAEFKGGSAPAFDFWVDTAGTDSPIDYSRNGNYAAGTGTPYTGITFKSADLYGASASTLPVIIDHFKEAMPILYYRKIPGRSGMDPTVTTGATAVAFMQNANSSFFGTGTPTVTSSIGSQYTQVAITSNYGTTTTPIFQQMLGNYIGTTWTPKGGYVLISAGPDHLYGTADDIIVSGGY